MVTKQCFKLWPVIAYTAQGSFKGCIVNTHIFKDSLPILIWKCPDDTCWFSRSNQADWPTCRLNMVNKKILYVIVVLLLLTCPLPELWKSAYHQSLLFVLTFNYFFDNNFFFSQCNMIYFVLITYATGKLIIWFPWSRFFFFFTNHNAHPYLSLQSPLVFLMALNPFIFRHQMCRISV